jgi:hypothetical protein
MRVNVTVPLPLSSAATVSGVTGMDRQPPP